MSWVESWATSEDKEMRRNSQRHGEGEASKTGGELREGVAAARKLLRMKELHHVKCS